MTKQEAVNELMSNDFSKSLIGVAAFMPSGTNDPSKTVDQFINAGLTHIQGYDEQIARDEIPASIIEYTVTELKQYIVANLGS